MIAEKKAANAVGAKTARACDSCLRRRARWYCAADDAFLCQACDSSVHSANQLARRHKRIRLETASSKMTMTTMAIDESSSSPSVNNQFVDNTVPAWHGGFRRKARTPRISKKILLRSQARNATSYDSDDKVLNLSLAFEDNDHDLVPEIGNEDEECPDENHDLEFHCRVPVFDPFASEVNGDDMVVLAHVGDDNGHTCDFHGSFDLPSDTDLAKFAADVENLLSNDDEEVAIEEDLGFDIKELGLLTGCKEEEGNQSQEAGLLGISSEEKGEGGTLVKVEEEEEHMVVLGGEGAECLAELGFDVVRDDSMDWDIECYNKHRMPGETDREKKIGTNVDDEEEKKTKRLLRLNYEGVMAAWPCQRCPWITGNRPEFDPNKDSWPNFSIGTTNCSSECHRPFGDLLGLRGQVGGDADGGREARVSRYREKRRTRMFSKKIRYQVRKLNAEKRPRMKGRFVKRTSSLELSLVSSRGRLN